MSKDAHAWKYEQAPDPRIQKPFQIRAQFVAEVRKIMQRRIDRFCGFNSSGDENTKQELKAALGEIERLA